MLAVGLIKNDPREEMSVDKEGLVISDQHVGVVGGEVWVAYLADHSLVYDLLEDFCHFS